MASPRTARPNRPRFAGWQKATALVPLVLLAGAWSASLGSSPTATADSADRDHTIPAVPTQSFDQPASYTKPGETTFPGISAHGDRPALDRPGDPSSVSANGIPAAALAAYRRAEAVMAQADPACRLSWALVAAIGRVESDHGRFGGSVLNADGVATPAIYGLPLTGSGNTARIADSDGGGYDNDRVYDRAVGPMQFIPSTWKIVGVDADGDGTKNPQDIDDAALATAVYLCAGTHDLGTTTGQRDAVFSYNHSEQYVALVLAIMNAYLDGDFSEVADGLPVSTFIPAKEDPSEHQRPDGTEPRHHHTRPSVQTPGTHDSPGTPDRPDRPDRPSNPGTHQPGNPDPDPGNPGNPGNPGQPSTPPSTSTPSLPDPTQPVQQTVETLGSVTEATRYCASHLPGNPTQQMITACGHKLVGKTVDQAQQLLTGTLLQVLTSLGLADLLQIDPPTCLPLLCKH